LKIADDHRLFQEGFKALFAIAEDITIVGEAEDGNTAEEGGQI
jgi:DNA-binding NarL/FixJ family response regulator